MKVNVEVAVETNADARSISVNFEDVPLDGDGKGNTQVDLGVENDLQWQVIGAPETTYKITLTPEQGQLNIEGDHPIDLEIAAGFDRAGGNRTFSIT